MSTVVHERDTHDPRPVLGQDGDEWTVRGYACPSCGYVLAATRPRCPVCHAALREQSFGPAGTVWAATVLRAGVPDRAVPLGLAYVDLDEGPRVLCHFGSGPDDEALAAAPAPGTRVVLAGLTDEGDPKVRPA